MTDDYDRFNRSRSAFGNAAMSAGLLYVVLAAVANMTRLDLKSSPNPKTKALRYSNLLFVDNFPGHLPRSFSTSITRGQMERTERQCHPGAVPSLRHLDVLPLCHAVGCHWTAVAQPSQQYRGTL